MIPLTEEHQDLREMVADFSNNELRPTGEHIDETGEFPSQQFDLLKELGLLGAPVAESYGGGDGDLLLVALICEELARGSGTVATLCWSHLWASLLVNGLASDELKARVLPALASGDKYATVVATEPGARSFRKFETTLDGESGSLRLNGSKAAVIGAQSAGLFVVAAQAENGPALVLVEEGAQAPGVRVEPPQESLGLRGAGLTSVEFVDTPAELLTSDIEALERIEELACLGVAAISTGLAREAPDYALGYANEREAFGRKIHQFEAIQLKVADGVVGAQAAQLMTYRAATLLEQGRAPREAHAARTLVGRMAYEATKEAVQILGGNGYSREYPVERMYRDLQTISNVYGSIDGHRLELARRVIEVL